MLRSDLIRQMLSDGEPYSKIHQELGAAISTINYHAKRLALDKPGKRSYDWSSFQKDIDSGMTHRALCKKHGFSPGALHKAFERKAISPYTGPGSKIRDFNLTLDEYCTQINGIRAKSHHRKKIRKLMVKDGAPYVCNECDLSEWRGRRLSLEVDHIDGDTTHNTKENFRFLCPNCHCVTPTWRGRNCKAARQKRLVLAVERMTCDASRITDHSSD